MASPFSPLFPPLLPLYNRRAGDRDAQRDPAADDDAHLVGQFRCAGTLFEVVVMAAAPDGAAPASASEGQTWLACFPDGDRWLGIKARAAPACDPLVALLTARERQIVEQVTLGLRNKQIAYALGLSEYTVAAYLKQACYKLQVRNRTALVTCCANLRRQAGSDEH